MNLKEFLNDLSKDGVELWIEADRLRYRGPKEALSSATLNEIKQYKSEIMAWLSEQESSTKVFPLSEGQKALWFIYKLAPNSFSYNIAFNCRIRSQVDVPALKKTFQYLINRHPMLRTIFKEESGVPRQEVQPTQEVFFELVEVGNYNSDEIYQKVVNAYQRPFNLEAGPLMRVSLFDCSDEDHILLITIHHIVSDAWSLWMLLDELKIVYPAMKIGTTPSLKPLRRSYSDFVNWQEQMLKNPEGEKLWDYWQQKLSGELPTLQLPIDKPRPPIQTYNGRSINFQLSQQLSEQLKNLARSEKVTLFVLMVTAFQVLLHRYTGQDDILIGSATTGRTQGDLENLFGYFVNPVVIRGNLSNNPTFKELLAQTCQTVLEAISHKDYPFPLLVQSLQPDRDPSYSPLFHVSIDWQQAQEGSEALRLLTPNKRETQINWGDLILEPFTMAQQEGQFDLGLEIIDTKQELFGVVNYNTDLFKLSTIERMVSHFKILLSGIVEDPEQNISQLPLLSETEKRQILVEWNDTEADYPHDKCIHQLFEEQVARTPEAVAVVYEEQQLTYRELNEKANQLAHYLKKLGVKPDELVGICVERSLEMVIGLLAILKSGGAYLPLDMSYPHERILYMLKDASVSVLLTQKNLGEEHGEMVVQKVYLGEDWPKIILESQESLIVGTKPNNLAYINYTSGSTGKPKGVLIPHQAVIGLVFGANYVDLDASQRLLQMAPISFDAATLELWGALLHGGCCVLFPEKIPTSEKLQQTIQDQKITTLWLTSALFNSIIDEEPRVLLGIENLLTGGEALSVVHIQKALKSLPTTQLINGYGPTENTTFTTFYPIPTVLDPLIKSIPIGRPISNTQVYILDRNLQLVPIGVTGELYAGGSGLAREYLNRPDLTEEKFIANPFSDNPSSRLYKTGDLCRYLPDGNIEYLGRIDNQVKIRGFRIELGEIEASLSQHPLVRESVVIVREDVVGDKRLVAYLVPTGETLSVKELREFLQRQLPEYMVPSAVVCLEAMPLTPNGKIDRRALPAPELSREGEQDWQAPATPMQELVARIWTEILKVEPIGLQDNFFALGGHSLLATQVISRIRSTFSVEVPLKLLFEAPTLAEFSRQIEQAQAGELGFSLPPIEAREATEPVPLSFAQSRLWFLNQLEGGSATYNIPGALQLVGSLNLAVLEQSLRAIVNRHEVLRTRFKTVNGSPVLEIEAEANLNLPVIDLSSIPAEEQGVEVQRRAQAEAEQPFNLATGTLVRGSLLKLATDDHVLLITMHHIVSDGWSIGIFIRELSDLYQAGLNGEPSPLPELAIQYGDFAHWQQQWLRGETLNQQLAYWQEQLAGIPPLLELPTDRPRPPVQSFRGGHQSFQLTQELSQQIKELSQAQGTTLFMTLMSAWAVLLYRYSGQEDLTIGTPIANRHHQEIEPLIGFFVNTLVTRTDLSEDPQFSQLLQQVRQVALEAYAHQDVPFEKLVEELQPERNLSHSPLFQVMFILQNAPLGELALPGLTITPVEYESAISKFDLTLSMEETESGLRGYWEYNSDLFEAETITRMIGHFQVLLEGIVANPEESVSQLPILTEAERQQLLVEWNDTSTDYPQDNCLHQLFEEQVERTPDAIAVVFEEQQLTYRELNEKANQLAHYLQKLGVQPDDLVGICVERSFEMVIGLLAILKSGGAYVPIDPHYPSERIEYMLEDSQTEILLTQTALITQLLEYQGEVIDLEGDWAKIVEARIENPSIEINSDNLAYVIYTSGSTGKPKGAMNAHRGVVNRLLWMQSQYGLNQQDTVLQKTPFSFDVSGWEFFWTLIAGAKLVVAKPEGHKDSDYLVETIVTESITTIHFVPSMLQVFLENDKVQQCQSLKRVICSGEAMPYDLQQRFFEQLNCELHNLYGPTEAAIDVSYWACQAGHPLEKVPIGRPVSNTQLYILDGQGQPAPIGVAGELHIGGVQVGKGYLNRPKLTAEKFIANPFSEDPNSRLYKTGDLCRYLPDGNIEYLGRIDNQVKIRGFRIELGEIEASLSQHAQVRETVVIVREDVEGDKRLVAYFVPSEENPSVKELREFIQQKLPEYMVPSAFVCLEVMPLTPNGKIDRRALPAPELSREGEKDFQAPVTPMQELIARIWTEILKVEPIGLQDNFFVLGGHSLLATQVISRIRSTFSVEVPLKLLFEAPTLAELSRQIEQAQAEALELSLPPIEPRERKESLPLSFAQSRLWFLDKLEGGSATYNMAGALKLRGSLNLEILEQSLRAIVSRHEVLRTRFKTVNGTPVLEIKTEAEFSLPIIDLSSMPAGEQTIGLQRQAETEAQQPFDLATGPLVRGSLLKLAEDDHVLVITMHHIVSDGWSIGIFIQELSALYQAGIKGEPSQLPELTIQYGDFAYWQQQWLTGATLEQQLAYWQEQLAGIPPLLELPTDHSRPPMQSFRGSHQSFQLSQELSQQIKQLSQAQGTTLFMTLISAWAVLLYRYSGQEDLTIGTPIANRNRQEIESLIGFFVNTLVMRTDLSGNPQFSQLLQQVKQVALEAYAHQDVPFEKLVEELQPERNLSHSPLFQVMFVLQNAPMDELTLPGLTITPVEYESAIAKFDLTVSMEETKSGLRGLWEYNSDLFEAETISRMIGHFQVLLEGIIANPEQSISQLPILTEGERQQLLVEWNDTSADYPQDKCLHQLFEEQVERTPDAIAVVYEEQQLTYAELNEQANQLAHYLQKLAVKPDDLVGICVERSLEMVIGLLAILKSGGAYVPIDPHYPKERIEYILSNSEAKVVITLSHLSTLISSEKTSFICLDTECETIAREDKFNHHHQVKPLNLCYVIYTSGSTGKPKGVQISHQSLVNFICSMSKEPGLSRNDCLLAVTTICFDIHTLEIYLPLVVGGKVIVASRETSTDGFKLAEAIVKHQANVMQATPASWRMLLTANWQGSDNFKAICGGEGLSRQLANMLREKVSCLWNIYGPTETTVWSTTGEVQPTLANEAQDGWESIGRPIANTQTYILDDTRQIVPVGVSGELHIGGDGLARGYLNRPDLTAAKFITNLFSEDPNSRLYKTGDLCRYLPDGNIEYLGRRDHQVKIRGFRIELGEIEASLSQHPQVRESVVIVREEQVGDKRLVAYVVSTDENLSVKELREFLQQQLPEYMVPLAFVCLEAMPLTPNGKVDRRALPAPELSRAGETDFQAPVTPMQELVARIWTEILKVEPIGLQDHFFALGGHSLLATQVISRIRSTFSVEVPLKLLFEAPTLAEFSCHIEQAQAGELGLSLPPIAPREKKESLSLSFAQSRLWFLDQLERGSATYNMPGAIKLNGSLNLAVLEQSLAAIVSRHEVLRSRFKTVNGSPVLEIENEAEFPLPIIDLSSIPAQEQTNAVQRRAQAEAQQPFDLAIDPLVRASLLKLADDDHVLLITMHHIVSDGWSIGIFIRELSALYQAGIEGEPSPLPELKIQYGDFAHWQQRWLTRETLEQQLDYWQKQLAGIPPLLELPSDRPRPPVQSFRGGHQSFQLSQELSQQIKQLSQAQGTTLFMTLMSAWAVLLYRYSGQEDLTIGTPIANRHHQEIEPLIGFFVNTLVMRTNLSGNPQFSQLLQQVRQVALEAYAHQDVPFEKLVEELHPERNLSHSPLFQVMFILQNAPMGELTLPGLTITQIDYESVIAKFDLTLSMVETESGLRGNWEYNSDLFEPETITRMIRHFQVLLEGIVANPEKSVSQLPILPEAERQQLLVEWNDTSADYPQDKCIHQLFEEQVARTPNAIAVVYEEQQLTYRELNEKANQLAHYLQELGVKPDDLIGICVERSLEMVIGLLGILKSGGAYVPIDPNSPRQRINYIVSDAQIKLLITQDSLTDSLPENQAEIIVLDQQNVSWLQERSQNLTGPNQPSNLAYVIYTSGSTGKPKGVLINHANVTRLFSATQSWYKFNQQDVWTMFHSYAFDFSVWELWGGLFYGGRVIVVPYLITRSPQEFYQLLDREKVTVLNQTPSAFQQLIKVDEKTINQKIDSLRLVIFGGEALDIPSLKPWFERYGDQQPQLVNMYGITETTVHVTYRPLTQADLSNSSSVIGCPIPDLQVYLLDKNLQPVPIGVPGEMCVGGSGVARGYFNRPELTEQKFIVNPFIDQSNSNNRLYRSGDLARYLPNGDIQYLGRIDHQVKVRGFRIELGEIEANLSQHPQVRESVVIIREEQVGDKRLVAYVVPTAETLSGNELREFLQQQLPEYMVPSAFVCLEAMPLTPNGKIDRRALPAPDQTSVSVATEFVPPRNPTEEILAAIWAEVLGLEQVGINDDFFNLGGHSLSAVQVISQVREAFQVDISLRSLFESSTIAELAKTIEVQKQQDSEQSSPAITRVSRKTRRMKLSEIQSS